MTEIIIGSGGSTGLTLSTLRSEVKSRGFDEVGDARIDRWINRAYLRICDRQAWDFLEDTITGAAPLEVPSLRAVLSVLDTDADAELEPEDRRTVAALDPTQAVSGSPQYWYYDAGTIAVYPISTTNLSVQFLKVPDELTDDDDTPIFPARYHYLIVDAAVCEAYKDSDNLEAWQILRGDVEEQIREMENAILTRNLDQPFSVYPRGSSVDW